MIDSNLSWHIFDSWSTPTLRIVAVDWEFRQSKAIRDRLDKVKQFTHYCTDWWQIEGLQIADHCVTPRTEGTVYTSMTSTLTLPIVEV